MGLIGRGWQVAQDALDSAGLAPGSVPQKHSERGQKRRNTPSPFPAGLRESPFLPAGDHSCAGKGSLVSMEMSLLSLTQTGEKTLLPYSLAAAAMEGSDAVRLQCRYTLQEGKLTPYLSYATVKEG